jgi:aromatic ring-opening dioxygenase LigB subunit
MQNFTPEELIQYLYGEASQEKVQEIEKALQTDWSLQQKIVVLKESQQQLNAITLQQPRKQAISAILDYARQTAEVEQ